MSARRVVTTKVSGWFWPWFCVVIFASCGPPLTQPSSLDVSGQWRSADQIGPVFNIAININQKPDGSIVGTWSSDVSPPSPACPPDLGAKPTGTVGGSNTVVGVQFSLLGAGDFQGQVIDNATLRGSFVSCSNAYVIVFSRIPPVPSG